MPFTFKNLSIPEVIAVEAVPFTDERGFFLECFKESSFLEHGIDTRFVQDNISHSTKGVLRGLHYQKCALAQAKLVTTIRGEIFDVAVDLRKGSPTYGRWVGEILSERNHRALYIPAGFAHGFLVLSDEADVYYKVSNEYSPEHTRGISWNDPDIGISWPLRNPIIKDSDAWQPQLKNADNDFQYRRLGSGE